MELSYVLAEASEGKVAPHWAFKAAVKARAAR